MLSKIQLTQGMIGFSKCNYINKTFDCSIDINSLTILRHIVNEKSKERWLGIVVKTVDLMVTCYSSRSFPGMISPFPFYKEQSSILKENLRLHFVHQQMKLYFALLLIQLQLSEHYNQTQLFYCFKLKVRKYLIGWLLVFNATFNNISVIALWSVLLVKETGVPGENHQPVASHWQSLLHNVASDTRGSNSQP